MTNCTRLAGSTASGDTDRDIQLVIKFCGIKRLTHNHSGSLAAKVFVERTTVYCDVARAAGKVYARDRRLPSTCSVMNFA
jgi:hypothetical protein